MYFTDNWARLGLVRGLSPVRQPGQHTQCWNTLRTDSLPGLTFLLGRELAHVRWPAIPNCVCETQGCSTLLDLEHTHLCPYLLMSKILQDKERQQREPRGPFFGHLHLPHHADPWHHVWPSPGLTLYSRQFIAMESAVSLHMLLLNFTIIL